MEVKVEEGVDERKVVEVVVKTEGRSEVVEAVQAVEGEGLREVKAEPGLQENKVEVEIKEEGDVPVLARRSSMEKKGIVSPASVRG
jgi:hypothetical protein